MTDKTEVSINNAGRNGKTGNENLIPAITEAVQKGDISKTVGKLLSTISQEDQLELVVQRNGHLRGLTEFEAKQIRREALGLPEDGGFEKQLGFDFKLCVSNVWKFNRVTETWRQKLGDFQGGVHPHLIANLLYYFSEGGQTVVDPMAGSGITSLVVQNYQYFNEILPNVNGSGPRTVYLYDLVPTKSDIIQNDILDGIPLQDGTADFTLLDPPYLNVPAKYYGDHPSALSKLSEMEWFEAMEFIARDVWRITKPGGRVAILTNDYLKDKRFIPVGYRMLPLFEEVGFETVALILDVHNNYVYNSNAFIVANAKRFRYRLNALRQIIVFEKNPNKH